MTHPGAGFGQVPTTMRRTCGLIMAAKIKEARPVPVTPLPHPLCTQGHTANDRSYIRNARSGTLS
jgi:hypothetical protein